jgi:hypothetical protein
MWARSVELRVGPEEGFLKYNNEHMRSIKKCHEAGVAQSV